MATKQDVKQIAVSKTESLVLMKNMMRISVSSICYMRDLFPEYCYKNKEYGAVGIHQLQAAKKDDNGEIMIINDEAFLLTQWLEKGVFLALESEYLSSMTFAIFTKHPMTQEDLLLETYEFKVSYQSDSPATINNVPLVSREAVKLQAAKFIRALTEFSGTLESLPDERWITLQLKYQEHTPADYEPEYFKAGNGHFPGSELLTMRVAVGNLHTPAADMKVKFAGLESLLFEDLCKVGIGHPSEMRTDNNPVIFNATTHEGGKPPSEVENWNDENQPSPNVIPSVVTPLHNKRKLGKSNKESQDIVKDMAQLQVKPTTVVPFDLRDSETGLEDTPVQEMAPNRVSRSSSPQNVSTMSEEEKTYVTVKDLVMNHGVVTIRACCERLNAKESDVKQIFARLIKEGVIQQKKKGGRYEVPLTQPTVVPVPTVGGVKSKSFYREIEDSATAAVVVSQMVENDDDIVESQTATEGLHAMETTRFNQQTLQLQQSASRASFDTQASGTVGATGHNIVADTYATSSGKPFSTSAFEKPTKSTAENKRKHQQHQQQQQEGESCGLTLSQNSECSEGPASKRSRKTSIIQDPINLTHVNGKRTSSRQ